MRKAALAGAGVALVLGLSACGGNGTVQGQAGPAPAEGQSAEGPFTSAPDLVRAASAKTQATQTAKVSMRGGSGTEQISADGQLRMTGGNVEMAMTMDTSGQKMEMRVLDRTIYIKAPEMAQGGKPWMKISADGDDPISQLLGSVFDQAAKQSDPSKALDQILKAGTITKSEQTTLDGQPTTLYSIDVDAAKAIEQSLDSMPKMFAAMKDKILANLKGKNVVMPMQVWLNDQQLPVQIVTDSSEMAKAAGAPTVGAAGKVTIKYTDWGGPVDVQAPPADQVGEFKMPEMPGMPTKPTR